MKDLEHEFYKMEYERWDVGTVDLSLEQEAAYLRLCHAIYRHKGSVPNSIRMLCGLWRCHHTKAAAILKSLMDGDHPKITLTTDGLLSNKKADTVLEDRRQRSTRSAEAGQQGGIRSGQARRNSLKNKEPDEAPASTKRSRGDESRGDKKREEKKVVALRAPAPSKASRPKTEKVVPRKKMPVPLPQDWKPSTVNNDYARGVGLSEFEFAKEVKKFRNYHHAKGTIFADWDAAWRNWCDKALEYLGRAARDLPPQQPRADALEVVRNWPREKWQQILRVYASTNNWPAAYGTPPGEPGCLVPPDLLQGPEEPKLI